MKRTIIFLATAALVLSAAPMFAQVSANLAVSAKVDPSCTISTVPVAFGNYDPLGANSTVANPIDANGSITITCTKGNGVSIDLDPGLNFNVTRRMAGGADFLGYELYQDAPGGVLWTSGAGTLASGGAPSKAARTYTVYGRLFGGQDVAAASYNDTVLATVNY